MGICKAYDGLSKLVRVIIQLLFGSIVGGLYRIFKFFDTKNVLTLVVGLLTTFTGVGNLIIWVVDLVTTILNGKITLFAD